ncbi:MAG: hypothetical protein KC475_00295, partial [Cyanobacteria bacterium HKST-UBA03]|nr:hypothetical protein [Cyanobacteria bacterium HKST-UBA03]
LPLPTCTPPPPMAGEPDTNAFDTWKRELEQRILHHAHGPFTGSAPLKILMLYSNGATFISTVAEYLESFQRYSQHEVHFASASNPADCPVDLNMFDVVLVHYSVRLYLDDHLSPHYAKALKRFGGFKALFIQDEYDHTNRAIRWMNELGLHTVFTCVPPEYKEDVYPTAKLPNVDFVQVLTGYVPLDFESFTHVKPMAERHTRIGYRGRDLSPRYGDLCREKTTIGTQMKALCKARQVAVDIEWDSSKRIYGDAWYDFVMSSRATLGTESGCNVFDFDGVLLPTIQAALSETPDLSYKAIHEKWLAPLEGQIMMNQVSPRIFEAIACRTALVLFEGTYSGVVEPDIHFIPLKKDFSNLDDVLAKLEDIPYLEQMTERAWVDVIESGRYSYRTFVGAIDHYLHRFVKRGNNSRLISGVVGLYDPDTKTLQPAITPCNEGHPTRQLQVYDWHRLAHDTSWMANPPPPKPDIPGKKKKTKLHKAVANEIKRFVRRRLKAESR